MVDFINEQRDDHGVESICSELPIAPSTYYRAMNLQKHPEKRSERAKSDEILSVQIRDVWNRNFQVYGYRKIWHALYREGIDVARCTVERLMKTA